MFKFYVFNWLKVKMNGILIPFVFYQDTKLSISKKCKLTLKGRVRFGTKLQKVSRNPISILFEENSQVKLGKGISFGAGLKIYVKKKAKFEIGDNTYFTCDSHIECVNSLKIGSDCAISWGVSIIDDDHHKIIYNGQSTNDQNSVIIGDKVWIGCNVTILKNTNIGDNCVVAAGTIVKGNFPDNVLIGGNPARILKKNVSWE